MASNPPASTCTGPIRMSLVDSTSVTIQAHDRLDNVILFPCVFSSFIVHFLVFHVVSEAVGFP